jgi:ComF family protein
LIHGFKFHKKLGLARLLGGLMAESLRDRIDVMPEALIPVPLHRLRLCERGFNQAMELARPVSRRLECSLAHDGCRRVRATEMQSLLSADARRRNVQGVFEITRRFPGHVAIIDDVMTTGSTVAELAQALRHAGAERVDVWVLARAAL